MAEIFKPKPREILLDWLSTIEAEASDKLTDWEINFISSITMRIDAGYMLTEQQEKTLERIYSEYTK